MWPRHANPNIDKLEESNVKDLILQCIHEDPKKRPTINEILTQKSNLSEEFLEQREIDRITFGKLNRLTNYSSDQLL